MLCDRQIEAEVHLLVDLLALVDVAAFIGELRLNLGVGELQERTAEIASTLQLETDQVIPFSSPTGEGRVELLEAIMDLVAAPTGETR